MKVTIENKKDLKTDLKVIIEKKIIDKDLFEKYNELKNKAVLKGFRPGKVPIEVLKRQFGKEIYGEVLEKILKETTAKILEEKKFNLANEPKIDLKKFGEDKDIEYLIKVEELPIIEINDISNIKTTNYEIKVKDIDIDKKIKEISENQNSFKDRDINEISQNNDAVIFDYKATINNKDFEGGEGKNTQIILGKDLFIKGFDKQLVGVKKNDEKIVEVNLPDNYPKKEYANKKTKFICKIINVQKPKKVEINDEFAKTLGAKDLSDLKKLISNQILDQYKQTLDSIAKNQIMDQLNKFKDFQIPEGLLEQEMKTLEQGMNKDDLEKNKKENIKSAKKRIKIGLILNQFGKKNNILVNEDEIKKEIQKQLRMMPGQEKMVMEYYQKNPSATESLRGGIYEDKIISLIKEKGKTDKKIISTEEAEKIILSINNKSSEDVIAKKEKKIKNKDKKIKKKPLYKDTKKKVSKK